jgi:hypothetical protein
MINIFNLNDPFDWLIIELIRSGELKACVTFLKD